MSAARMSDDEDEDAPKKLVHRAEHSLFVRNLSPQVSEQTIRDVFASCDVIEKVAFRSYPNSNSQFFAQVDFASLKGVAEGSKLSGVPILGVPCEIGVVDPVVSAKQLRLAKAAGDALPEPGAPRDLEELNKRISEAKEDQRLRTVHISGISEGTDTDMLARFCKNFGDVEKLKVDRDARGVAFGLVEFKERGPAHIVKTQQKYAVDGKVFTCTESKVMVDESEFMEQTIQFQESIRDAMSMRQILAQQPDLKDKLDKVRAAALELLNKDAGSAAEASKQDGATLAVEDAKEKSKKKKKDKAEKKAEKLAKKKEKKERKKKQKQKAKKAKKKTKKRKRQELKDDGGLLAEDEEEESAVASISESPDGPVDLESEVEMIDNSELLVLGTSSASSLSSGCASDAEPEEVQRGSNGSLPAQKVQLTLAALEGRWMVRGGTTDLWTVLEAGRTLFNGRRVKSKWSLVEDRSGGDPVVFCEGQRAAGWELDMQASSIERLVWNKAEQPETHWERQAEEPAAAPAGPSPTGASASSPPAG